MAVGRSVRTIGIDPGSRLTGYGIVEKHQANLLHIDCGVIAPPAKASLADRLCFIQDELEKIIDTYKPLAAAAEGVFFARNWRSALKLGQARGAALAALARRGLSVEEYPPATVKQAVVGYGRADKQQVQQMVKILLGLPEIPEENSADALAVAICHIHGPGPNLKGWR